MISEAPIVSAMVKLPAGSFVMGETENDKFATDTERPAHRVAIAQAFAIARFPVTVGEYRAFAPYHDPGDHLDLPVVNVNWDDTQAYCARLRSETGDLFRLPTEAEWEYACRGGARTPFNTGAEITPADANYLYAENGQRIGPGARTPAGRYVPNTFGLHDLHGNVCEWTEDVWHASYDDAPADGSAWILRGDRERRVIRGGAWDYLPRLLRSAWRDALPHTHRRDNVGFRLARTLES
jgi:formylglycine-generating enzyme required for sulfatase activity